MGNLSSISQNFINLTLTSLDEPTFTKTIAEEREYGVDYEKIEQQYHFAPSKKSALHMELEDLQAAIENDDHTVTNEFTSSNISSNDKLDAIYLPYDFITPSQTNAIPPADELRLRSIAGEIITEAGYSLRLPWYAVITAQALFQRFYYRYMGILATKKSNSFSI